MHKDLPKINSRNSKRDIGQFNFINENLIYLNFMKQIKFVIKQ